MGTVCNARHGFVLCIQDTNRALVKSLDERIQFVCRKVWALGHSLRPTEVPGLQFCVKLKVSNERIEYPQVVGTLSLCPAPVKHEFCVRDVSSPPYLPHCAGAHELL
jgi:hypothetical protein